MYTPAHISNEWIWPRKNTHTKFDIKPKTITQELLKSKRKKCAKITRILCPGFFSFTVRWIVWLFPFELSTHNSPYKYIVSMHSTSYHPINSCRFFIRWLWPDSESYVFVSMNQSQLGKKHRNGFWLQQIIDFRYSGAIFCCCYYSVVDCRHSYCCRLRNNPHNIYSVCFFFYLSAIFRRNAAGSNVCIVVETNVREHKKNIYAHTQLE